MTIIDILSQNAEKYPYETALVEINPKFDPEGRITWREYALMQPEPGQPFRREITWIDFERKANRFANLLFTRGCKKGDKVAILLMNSIEWLPQRLHRWPAEPHPASGTVSSSAAQAESSEP